VNISARTEYGCIALLELALHDDAGQPVRVRQIAEKHGIPPQFLVQILSQLRGAGLVVSTRGAAGGYQLARDPGRITLGEAIRVMEGPPQEPSSNAGVETRVSRTLTGIWRQVAEAEGSILESVTLADLADEAREAAGEMFYI
jgi:Rrf2 family protein